MSVSSSSKEKKRIPQMCPTASARRSGMVRQRVVIYRRQQCSYMCIGGGFWVAASFLNCCRALTQLRPNLRTSYSSIHGFYDRYRCIRLSGGEESGMLIAPHVLNDSKAVHCLFRIKVPHTMPGDTVKIAGGAESIGNWKKDRALNLTTSEQDFPWSVAVVDLK